MRESLELPRELLNGFHENADRDMDSEVQAEVISDGDEELVGNWNKGNSCPVLEKRLAAFYPCPRDLWNFELEKDDFEYLVEKISKWQSIQEEMEHKRLENLQPDNAVEKNNPFTRKKLKPAAEICISNKQQNVNHQDNRENVSTACQQHLRRPLPSQAWRLGGKMVLWAGPRVPLLSAALGHGACIPAASVPAMAKRSQGAAQAITSEGASPKPWQLTCGGEPVQKSRTEVWEPSPSHCTQPLLANFCSSILHPLQMVLSKEPN
ncbi:uncharacterized protein [Macaca nemestrina]|uniref:uncharacterized protein n=1 Tax=Macaca nemestrina TaxID=9545 RepID=UPI0039B8CCF2